MFRETHEVGGGAGGGEGGHDALRTASVGAAPYLMFGERGGGARARDMCESP